MYQLIQFASGCESERDAARALGYDYYSWDVPYAEQPDFTEKKWVEMTDEEKAALVILDYSERTWDRREPRSSFKLWGDLTDEETEAAEVLGYRATKWNDKAGNAKSPEYASRVWSNFTYEEQAALGVLGFTEVLWDDGTSGRPRSSFKPWAELTICGEDISVAHTVDASQCMDISRWVLCYYVDLYSYHILVLTCD